MARTKKSLPGGIKRRHRGKPGTAAVREIRKYQETTELLIPTLSFKELVCEILRDIPNKHCNKLRIKYAAIDALQEAAESYVVKHIQGAYSCTLHDNRTTLMLKDMERIKENKKIFNLA